MRSGIYFSGFFRGVFLYIINFAGRISEAAMGGAGDIIFFRVPSSLFRVRRSSVGCSVRCSVAQQLGCSVAQEGPV